MRAASEWPAAPSPATTARPEVSGGPFRRPIFPMSGGRTVCGLPELTLEAGRIEEDIMTLPNVLRSSRMLEEGIHPYSATSITWNSWLWPKSGRALLSARPATDLIS